MGEIGLDVFKFIMQDDRFRGIPLILETIDETLWKEEIQLLRGFSKR
jgi:deoxyribonuclease-4